MIVCPVCEFRNPDANEQCFRCSAILKRNADFVDEAFKRADKKASSHLRGQLWRAPLERIQSHRWVQRLNEYEEYDPGRYRYPFTAGLLSILLPGLGHLYAGQPVKGKALIPVGIAFYVIAVLTLTQPWSNYFLFGMMLFWMVIWGSSVAVALTLNGASTVRRHVIALFFAAMFLVGMAGMLGQFFGLTVISLQKITSSNMAPALVRGERVLFSPVPLWYREPHNDEVIMFDPPRFTAERAGEVANTVVSINIRRYYQRVLGREGDHLRKVGDQIWRNRQLLGADQLPFGLEVMGDFDLIVPKDRLFAPVTRIPEPDMMAAFTGAPNVRYYGEPGYAFIGWEGSPFIGSDIVAEVGIAVVNPPERRRWLR